MPGCNENKADMGRNELLEQLTALDFAKIDIHLYLNTHPMDKEALRIYNSLVAQCNMVKQNYERLYGPIAMGSPSAYPWQWIKEPWPWEYEANFKLSGEESK